MSSSLAPEGRLVQYLLGRMSEAERAELEAGFVRDQDLDEELLAATDDLIRAYLMGALPEEDRSRFETHFLAAPENCAQLDLMRDLLAAVERVSEEASPAAAVLPAVPLHRNALSESGRSSWIAIALRSRALAAAAVVTLAVAVAAVVVARRMGEGEKRAAASPRPAVSATPSVTEPASPMPPVPDRTTVRVVRLPRQPGSPVNVLLSPSTRTLRVEVPVNLDGLSFDAAVLAADGTEVWRAERRAPSAPGQPLILEVPARLFAVDRYTLQVEEESLRTAVAPVLEYHLHVVRER